MMTDKNERHDLLLRSLGFDAVTQVDDEVFHYCDARSEPVAAEGGLVDLW